ncbi:hypothetical protein GCM10009826_40610 [Humibacillus xanthopallidus]
MDDLERYRAENAASLAASERRLEEARSLATERMSRFLKLMQAHRVPTQEIYTLRTILAGHYAVKYSKLTRRTRYVPTTPPSPYRSKFAGHVTQAQEHTYRLVGEGWLVQNPRMGAYDYPNEPAVIVMTSGMLLCVGSFAEVVSLPLKEIDKVNLTPKENSLVVRDWDYVDKCSSISTDSSALSSVSHETLLRFADKRIG